MWIYNCFTGKLFIFTEKFFVAVLGERSVGEGFFLNVTSRSVSKHIVLIRIKYVRKIWFLKKMPKNHESCNRNS